MTFGREVLFSRDEIFSIDFLLAHLRTQGNPGQNARMFFMQTFFTPDRTIERHIDQVTQKFAIMRGSFKDQTVLHGMLEQPKKKTPVTLLSKHDRPSYKKKKKATNGRRKKKKTTESRVPGKKKTRKKKRHSW